MKFTAVIAALLATSSYALIGRGPCPSFKDLTVPWAPELALQGELYIHYADNLIYNAYSLFNLVVRKQYKTLDCFKLSPYLAQIDEPTYTNLANGLQSGKYPAWGGLTYFDATTGTVMGQVCADAGSLAVFVTDYISGNVDLPEIAIQAIGIATILFKSLHLQANVVLSTSQDLGTTVIDAIESAITTGPGEVPMSYIRTLDVTTATCGSTFHS